LLGTLLAGLKRGLKTEAAYMPIFLKQTVFKKPHRVARTNSQTGKKAR
jgi:hypothetical protein